MKKFIISIFALLYLSSSMGATVHLHYCMGKLVDWGLAGNNSSSCNGCGMEKSHSSIDKGCCKDEFQQIKNYKDQKVSPNLTQLNKAVAELGSANIPVYSLSFSCALFEEIPKSHAPPRSIATSLNIINCVFRI